MQVDIMGLENVVKYIEAAKKTKFTIVRAGASAHMAVFECLESNTNAWAVDDFKRWAEVMNNAIPYKIILFDFAEFTTGENGETVIKKGKSRGAKCEATFILNTFAQNVNTNLQNIGPGDQSFDAKSFRESIIKEIVKEQEENKILNAINAISARLTDLETEEEEEEEEEANGLGALGDQNQMAQLMGLINAFKGEQKPPVINGVKEQTENINKAIKILYKYDKSLDTDLLKLAEIAEKNPDTFNLLITNLRTM